MIISVYNKVIIILLSILFLPSLLYVTLKSSSMAVGLMVSLILLLILVNKKNLPRIENKFVYLFSLFLLFQYIYTFFYDPGLVIEKQIISLFFLFLIFISAGFFALEFQKIQSEQLNYLLKWLSIFILAIGLLSQVVTIDFANYVKFPKAVFPYSEPSHYALTTGGVLFATGFLISSLQRVILLILLLILTMLFPSTLLLVLSLMMLIVYYSSDIKKVTLLVLLLLMAFLFVSDNIKDFQYFSSRLNISSNNTNLTTLVYLQGIDDAYRSFITTNGIGLGFQNMGSIAPSKISNLIHSLSGYYKNRNDGGFLAAKIVSEFGLIGLILLVYYLKFFYRSFVFLRNMSNSEYTIANVSTSLIFSHSIIMVFFIELFVRGYGYFSPGVFFVLFALFVIRKRREDEK